MSAAPRPSADLSPRVRILLGVAAIVLLWASIALYGDEPEGPVQVVRGDALGTTWSVKIASTGLTAEQDSATAREIALALGRVDALMSTWKPQSELSRFNAERTTDPIGLSEDTIRVFEIARQVSVASQGAFDVTVGPLVQAWGFGSEGRHDPPSDERLAALRDRVGYEKLSIDVERQTVAKQHPEVEADLSAVAKGYAVDLLAAALDRLGYDAYLVELGGELRAKGTHLDGASWRVAIETPDAPGRSVHRVVPLRDQAMATSGDYRNYYERDGKRLSHTIDPRTGRPIEHRLASVTVLHDEAAFADAWATALNVLGPDVGYELAISEGLPAYFIVRSGSDGEFETKMTPAFAAVIEGEPDQ